MLLTLLIWRGDECCCLGKWLPGHLLKLFMDSFYMQVTAIENKFIYIYEQDEVVSMFSVLLSDADNMVCSFYDRKYCLLIYEKLIILFLPYNFHMTISTMFWTLFMNFWRFFWIILKFSSTWSSTKHSTPFCKFFLLFSFYLMSILPKLLISHWNLCWIEKLYNDLIYYLLFFITDALF